MKKGLLLGVLLLLAAFCWYGNVVEETAAEEPEVYSVEPLPEKTYVYITGAVRKPGLYAFTNPVTAGEAVEAAGNVTAYADVSALNLAEPASCGQHLHIPYDFNGIPAQPAEAGKVSLNTADEKALTALPGIGPAMAKNILAYRQEHGSFTAIEELEEVKGIGPAKFAQLKDLVCL